MIHEIVKEIIQILAIFERGVIWTFSFSKYIIQIFNSITTFVQIDSWLWSPWSENISCPDIYLMESRNTHSMRCFQHLKCTQLALQKKKRQQLDQLSVIHMTRTWLVEKKDWSQTWRILPTKEINCQKNCSHSLSLSLCMCVCGRLQLEIKARLVRKRGGMGESLSLHVARRCGSKTQWQ